MSDEQTEPGNTNREGESSESPTIEVSYKQLSSFLMDAVDMVSSEWDSDERLDARKDVARNVLAHAVDTGDYVGKQTALDMFYDEYPVDGQDETTWWRENARKALSEVGDYSQEHDGYRVTVEDLKKYINGET